jgi:hypothetical protein
MKTKVEPSKQSLEHMVMSADYRERDQAMVALTGAIQAVLHPRSTRSYTNAGVTVQHFLPIPDSPKSPLGKVWLRMPTGEVNPAEQAAFAAELEAIGRRKVEERRQGVGVGAL